jgi:hypothetical protein
MSIIYKNSVKKMTLAKKTKTTKFPLKRAKPITGTTILPVEKEISKNNKVSEKHDIQKNLDSSAIKNICASIRSTNEPHLRCLMRTKNNEKYCAIHLSQKNIIDFNLVDEDILDLDIKISEPTKIITNSITRKLSLTTSNRSQQNTMNQIIKTEKESTMHEQKVSTIENSLRENEDELEIKLLILVNDEYCDKITELIGPVFQDVTLSEDEQDPVTFDEIWTLKDGKKIPSSMNKYYLFSYIDSKGKIRCLTIFTIYNMIKENNFIHPVTMETIPDEDIKRAKQLIDLYETKIGLFKEDNSNLSPEFKLKNRLTKLFKQFHTHSIYLEENWFLTLKQKSELFKIIKETEKLISNNIKSINPNLHNFKIFQKKDETKYIQGNKKVKKGKKNESDNDDDNSIFGLQEYIVTEWERLIQAADNSQNQIPIWILASGLSFVVPQVKQKYPDLEIMMQ